MKSESKPTRAYRQTARAKAAEITGERIIGAFLDRLRANWFDEIRLDDIATEAEVTVQTVIRRFGGKDGLLEASFKHLQVEMVEARQLPVGDVRAAVDAIIKDYEQHGDFVIRLLAQEERYAAIRALTDFGRRDHRRWVGEVFEPWLEQLEEHARNTALDRLVIALDIYIWKLVRVDMKRSREALRDTMLTLCGTALNIDPKALEKRPSRGKTNVESET